MVTTRAQGSRRCAEGQQEECRGGMGDCPAVCCDNFCSFSRNKSRASGKLPRAGKYAVHTSDSTSHILILGLKEKGRPYAIACDPSDAIYPTHISDRPISVTLPLPADCHQPTPTLFCPSPNNTHQALRDGSADACTTARHDRVLSLEHVAPPWEGRLLGRRLTGHLGGESVA